MIQMPDIKLKAVLDAILGKIRSDYVDAGVKSTTFLYKMYNGLVSGNYVFLDEAVKIFTRTGDDPRIIDTRLLFDRERVSLPTIHVTIPSEEPHGDGIGQDDGYVANTLDAESSAPNQTMTEYYTRGYNTKFELIITGSNSFEVVLIFTTLKAALINNVESLEVNGFRNPKISGGDLKINEQLTPNAYMRVLNLSSYFELIIPKFDSIAIVNSINWTETPVNEFTE